MLKKTITYTDFNGNERTEDFYFNLTQSEMMEMELGVSGGMVEMVQRIVAAQDGPEIMRVFKNMILNAYGQKSPDGKRFIKNDKLREEFSQTNAYDKLFMELAINDKAAAAFVNGIMPADLDTSSVPSLVK